jgi:hypothetical protein
MGVAGAAAEETMPQGWVIRSDWQDNGLTALSMGSVLSCQVLPNWAWDANPAGRPVTGVTRAQHDAAAAPQHTHNWFEWQHMKSMGSYPVCCGT